MEAIEKVEFEVEKVLSKFTAISEHSSNLIQNEVNSIEMLKSTLLERKYFINSKLGKIFDKQLSS